MSICVVGCSVLPVYFLRAHSGKLPPCSERCPRHRRNVTAPCDRRPIAAPQGYHEVKSGAKITSCNQLLVLQLRRSRQPVARFWGTSKANEVNIFGGGSKLLWAMSKGPFTQACTLSFMRRKANRGACPAPFGMEKPCENWISHLSTWGAKWTLSINSNGFPLDSIHQAQISALVFVCELAEIIVPVQGSLIFAGPYLGVRQKSVLVWDAKARGKVSAPSMLHGHFRPCRQLHRA